VFEAISTSEESVDYLLASAVEETAKAIGATATMVGAVAGVFAARRASTAVRDVTTPAASDRSNVTVGGEASGAIRGQGELNRETEGFIVRFLIFFLVLQLWSAFLRVFFDPLRVVSGAVYFDFPFQLVDIGIGVVYALIFLTLGLPLLIDIYRRYGISGRPRAGRSH
jgi:hypothetical protein